MTNHDHAATGPGPGPGPRPASGAGPTDAAPAAADEPRVRGREGEQEHGAQENTGPAAGTTASGPGAAAPGAAGGPADVDAGEDGPAPRFRRDRRYKMIGGVCAGLGRKTDMDPVIFRITLAVLAAAGGVGLIFYGFAWLFVPYEDEEENEVRKLLTGRVDGQALAAVLFALVGCGVFLMMLRNGGVLLFAAVLSLLLAGAGYWSQRRDAPGPDPLAAQAVADAPPEAKAPPAPGSYPSWWRDPIVKDGTHVGGTGYLWGPGDSRDRDLAAAVNISRGTSWIDGGTAPTAGARPAKARGPRWIGGWIFLFAVLAGGLGARHTWDDHPLTTSLQTGLSCALVVFGLGIAISAFLGRTGAGSVFLAIVTAALLAASTALPTDLSTHWSHTSWVPVSKSDVQRKYELGTGVGTLDLSKVHLSEGQTLRTGAEVGVGRLRVIVPADATVRVAIDVGVGDIQLPGDGKRDVDVAPGKHKNVDLTPPAGSRNAGTIDIDLQVGVGQAEVSRAAS